MAAKTAARAPRARTTPKRRVAIRRSIKTFTSQRTYSVTRPRGNDQWTSDLAIVTIAGEPLSTGKVQPIAYPKSITIFKPKSDAHTSVVLPRRVCFQLAERIADTEYVLVRPKTNASNAIAFYGAFLTNEQWFEITREAVSLATPWTYKVEWFRKPSANAAPNPATDTLLGTLDPDVVIKDNDTPPIE